MDGLRRFGITDDSTSLIAVKVVNAMSTHSIESAYQFLTTSIQGQEIPVTDSNIQARCEVSTVLKKNYKLPNSLDLSNPQLVNGALVGALTLRGS